MVLFQLYLISTCVDVLSKSGLKSCLCRCLEFSLCSGPFCHLLRAPCLQAAEAAQKEGQRPWLLPKPPDTPRGFSAGFQICLGRVSCFPGI